MLLLIVSASGCYIPTWRCRTPRPLQSLENRWGDFVDCVGHQSPVNQPWCDPHYCRVGIYRVAPYGPFGPPREPAVHPAARSGSPAQRPNSRPG